MKHSFELYNYINGIVKICETPKVLVSFLLDFNPCDNIGHSTRADFSRDLFDAGYQIDSATLLLPRHSWPISTTSPLCMYQPAASLRLSLFPNREERHSPRPHSWLFYLSRQPYTRYTATPWNAPLSFSLSFSLRDLSWIYLFSVS